MREKFYVKNFAGEKFPISCKNILLRPIFSTAQIVLYVWSRNITSVMHVDYYWLWWQLLLNSSCSIRGEPGVYLSYALLIMHLYQSLAWPIANESTHEAYFHGFPFLNIFSWPEGVCSLLWLFQKLFTRSLSLADIWYCPF